MALHEAPSPTGVKVLLPAGDASIYGQFCPVAMATELLATRWTLVVLGEMLSGSTRFNEIRRGVLRMSSALLAKRMRQLETAGVLTRTGSQYTLTAAGRDLAPIVQGLGRWALRWVSRTVRSATSIRGFDVEHAPQPAAGPDAGAPRRGRVPVPGVALG